MSEIHLMLMKESCDRSLVSIGMPIRNGGETLERAIESVINQTYKNLEIIISDNCSTDQTAEVCQRFAAQDPRIRYIRQNKVITAVNNFRFVFEQSHGKYFAWAAHDDLRSENYIEVLLKGFEKVPSASIVFSDVAIFNDYRNYRNIQPTEYDFESGGLTFIQKLKKGRCFSLQIYGLINSKYLFDYAWYDIDIGADHLILLALLCHGDFVYSAGAMLYSWKPESCKTMKERAVANSLKKLKPFSLLRISWMCAVVVTEAESKEGRNHNKLLLFLLFYFYGLKSFICARSPSFLRLVWRKWKEIKSEGKT